MTELLSADFIDPFLAQMDTLYALAVFEVLADECEARHTELAVRDVEVDDGVSQLD